MRGLCSQRLEGHKKMKIKMIITIVALWITCGAVFGGNSVFTATVIQLVDEKQAALMSVEPVDPVQGAVNPPQAYSIVFVRGNFSGAVDGSRYKVMGCVDTGT